METQSDCQISGIRTHEVDVLWPGIQELVQSALDHGQQEYLAEDIYFFLMNKLAKLYT